MVRFYIGLAVVVAVLGAGLYMRGLILENHRLKADLKTANQTVKALDEAAKKRAAIYETERTRLDAIDEAPESDDGPVAPVLRRAIDGLR